MNNKLHKSRSSFCSCILIATISNFVPTNINAEKAYSVQRDDQSIPKFSVASVSVSNDHTGSTSSNLDPDGMRIRDFTLVGLIALAYDKKPNLVSGGPSWVRSVGFNVTARIAPEDMTKWAALSVPAKRSLLQDLLRDRFHLQLTRSMKQSNVYRLTLSKSTLSIPKHQNSSASTPLGSYNCKPGMFTGYGVTLSEMASGLEDQIQVPIIDTTGNKGVFDINLQWNPNSIDGLNQSEEEQKGAETQPSLVEALSRLGLNLRSAKAPVESLVIQNTSQLQDN